MAMNTRKLLVLFTALVGLALSATAQSTKVTEATVAKLTGSATVTLPDGSTAAVTQGMKIPQGATIATAADGEVLLQTHASTAATLKANTTVSIDELNTSSAGGKVTEEVTTLNLKNGNLISALDPSKKNVNNYKVRTAKGVAAARGTTFSVVINGATYSVTTTSGGVSFTGPNGSFTVGAGQTTDGGGNAPISIADMPTATPEQAAAKQAAVAEMTNVLAAVAVAVTANIVPASELTTAVTAAVTAAPAAASTIAATVATVAPATVAAVNAGVQAVPSTVLSDSAKSTVTTTATSAAQNSPAATTTTTTTTTTGQTTTTTTTTTTTVPTIDTSITVSRSGE